MALGASRPGILRLVLGQGLRVVLAGLGIGAAASLLLARLMASLLFEVNPHGPGILAAVSTLLLALALLAGYLPARRAARVDPMVALRYE